jgi:DNA (cytosine-5)-methyltransferase 1
LQKGYYIGSQLVNFPWNNHAIYTMEQIKNINWPDINTFKEDSIRDSCAGIIAALTVQYWFEKNDVIHHPNALAYFKPRNGLIRMQSIEEGDVSRKSYKRLHRWRYSPTAAYGNNEVHLHPYKIRRISASEALAIQSLPKEFELPQDMSLSHMFKTIGNGVPFLLSKGVADTIREFLEVAICKE